MTRRAALAACLSTATVAASAEQPWEKANAYARAYAAWAEIRNTRVSNPAAAGTISYPEVTAWQRVKSMWRDFEPSQDAEYR